MIQILQGDWVNNRSDADEDNGYKGFEFKEKC